MTYADGTEALRGVSFVADAGVCLGYLGPNGSGKSTTVHILSAAMRPTSGFARICGFDVVHQKREVYRRIGLATQDVHIDWIISAGDNLRYFGVLQGLSRKEATQRTATLLSEFGLAEKTKSTGWALSGGQARRLQLAIALLRSPDVLFLDEPTLGLDPTAKTNLLTKLHGLLESGTTIFFSSNDMHELEILCSRIIFVHQGRIVAEGPTRQFVAAHSEGRIATITFEGSAPSDLASVVGSSPGVSFLSQAPHEWTLRCEPDAITHVLRLLLAKCMTIVNISIREPSLDDAFKQLSERGEG
jgi:ABC-type multidrug transport system ATPase subunit